MVVRQIREGQICTCVPWGVWRGRQRKLDCDVKCYVKVLPKDLSGTGMIFISVGTAKEHPSHFDPFLAFNIVETVCDNVPLIAVPAGISRCFSWKSIS